MPTYTYQCSECQHTFEEFHLIADRDKPTKEVCPKCGKENCVTKCVDSVGIADPVRVGVGKNSSQYREVFDRIKKSHPRGSWKDCHNP